MKKYCFVREPVSAQKNSDEKLFFSAHSSCLANSVLQQFGGKKQQQILDGQFIQLFSSSKREVLALNKIIGNSIFFFLNLLQLK